MFDFTQFDLAAFESSTAAAARLLRALGSEKRLQILCQLTDGERPAGALLPRSGLSQSALSQHLAVLREEGIVATRREAQTLFYRIADPAALEILAKLAEIFCPKP